MVSSSSLSQAAEKFFPQWAEYSLNAMTISASLMFVEQLKHTWNFHHIFLINFYLGFIDYFFSDCKCSIDSL